NTGHRGASITPFIKDLLENQRIGKQRNEIRPQHFDTLPRDLFNNGRTAQEPPAPEGHEIAELSRVHAEFVLIFAAQRAHEKAIFRISPANILDRPKIHFTHRIAGLTNSRIYLTADSEHQG